MHVLKTSMDIFFRINLAANLKVKKQETFKHDTKMFRSVLVSPVYFEDKTGVLT